MSEITGQLWCGVAIGLICGLFLGLLFPAHVQPTGVLAGAFLGAFAGYLLAVALVARYWRKRRERATP